MACALASEIFEVIPQGIPVRRRALGRANASSRIKVARRIWPYIAV